MDLLLAIMVLATPCALGGSAQRIGDGAAPGSADPALVASRLSVANSELICGRAYRAQRRANFAVTPPPQVQPSTRLDEIALKEKGGTYLAPALVNGSIVLDFHVDSGSSDVSLPRGLFISLVRAGTIQESDFIGARLFQMADGRNVPSETFRIRTLQVGNHRLDNVVASVGDERGSLLLGQSFLSRFSAWSIDNNRRVLILR
ncbi:MAG TPA: retropepsin-like aspartic protease [Caulobacteraceae bacterium]|nr:retropepsin-like aspartic protease [Caulobacteraceae bacterium]